MSVENLTDSLHGRGLLKIQEVITEEEFEEMKQLRGFLILTRTICFRNFGLAIVFTLLMNFFVAQAQTNVGRISGTVSDSTGAVVPNASVIASDAATNFSRTATTDENGYYTLTNLPVGTYSVSVEVQSFKKSIKTENALSADARLTVDFALEAGQISEVVEVTQSSGETVNTTSGEVGKVIDNQQIENLALNGRNYYQLLSVVPGAVVTADDSLDTNLATNTININGNRGVSNNLTVDGGNNLNAGSNASQINNVGLDFIQEVKNSFSLKLNSIAVRINYFVTDDRFGVLCFWKGVVN